MDDLCERTACLYKPGVKMPGMKCRYAYTGRVPGTGRLACQTCGKTKPEERQMKYTIKPGIAAIVDVYCDDFPERFGERKQSYIFMAEGKPVEKGVGDTVAFEDLPLAVRAAINKHFGTVFATPVGQRGDYLKNLIPWEVEG